MSIEAMKQALEAWQTSVYGSERHHKAMLMAMTNMGQVIAEAEKQEPVAHMYPDDLEKFQTEETFAYAYSVEMGSPTKGNTVPLYDRPQPKRYVATPREPLTDEQIDEIWRTHLHRDSRVRAIEAAHGITSDMKQEHVDKTAKQRHEENT